MCSQKFRGRRVCSMDQALNQVTIAYILQVRSTSLKPGGKKRGESTAYLSRVLGTEKTGLFCRVEDGHNLERKGREERRGRHKRGGEGKSDLRGVGSNNTPRRKVDRYIRGRKWEIPIFMAKSLSRTNNAYHVWKQERKEKKTFMCPDNRGRKGPKLTGQRV